MNTWLLLPPIAFLIVFAVMLFQLFSFKIFSKGIKNPSKTNGSCKAYACGENVEDHKAQPDYSQFFPFAFFFTIMHVVALIVATVPKDSYTALILACCYIITAAVGLSILFRK